MLLASLAHCLPTRSALLLTKTSSLGRGLWKANLQAAPRYSKFNSTRLQTVVPRQGKSLLPTRRNGRRNFSDEHDRDRSHMEQRSRTGGLKDRLMGPPTENAYGMGKGAVAGAALMGLIALGYYGLGMSNEPSIYDHSTVWPQYVRDRIHATYAYFGGSCILTAASAAAVFQTDALLQLIMRTGWISTMVTMGIVMATGALTQALPYEPGLGTKQLAWALHCAVLGAVIAPMCFLGGPLLLKAFMYTGGIVGGLSVVAACAPSERFLHIGGPLAIGLGLVFAASLASMWLPPTTAIGAGLASLSLYGGLILFSGFLLHDTQRVVKAAEHYPEHGHHVFDPISHAMAIYMDALNIFIRIAIILSQQDNSKGRSR